MAGFLMVMALGAAVPAMAADHQVRMLNRGTAGAMVFEPSALRIEPGDTVTFVSVDPGHNAESMQGMSPEGAESFRTPLGKDETVSFTVPGVYGVKCTPHLAMGMVAVIQVGDDKHNIETLKAKKNPPLATRRLNEAYKELGL